MSLLRRPAVVLASLAVIVVALAVITNALPLRQIVDQRQEVDAARERLDELTTENAVLADQVAALHTPLEIERLAREKLGYVRPGEETFVVIEEPTERVSLEEAPAPPAEGGALGLVTKIVDFITGRDLVDE